MTPSLQSVLSSVGPAAPPPQNPGLYPIPGWSPPPRFHSTQLTFQQKVDWVAFGTFAASATVVFIMTQQDSKRMRLFHWITTMAIVISAISYYAMAAGMGSMEIHFTNQLERWYLVRHVNVIRLVNWCLATPLIMVDLALLAGLPVVDVAGLVVASIGVNLTALLAILPYHDINLGESRYPRWSLFAFSALLLAFVTSQLMTDGRKAAYGRSTRVGHLYTGLTVWTATLLAANAVVTTLGIHTGTISPHAEGMAYAALDVLSTADFGLMLLAGLIYCKEAGVSLPDGWLEPSQAVILPVAVGDGGDDSANPESH